MLRLDFVTLFPEVVRTFLGHSILGRAQASGRLIANYRNPREYCYDRHAKVDDAPFGGGPGMLIKAEPVALAIESLGLLRGVPVLFPDPAGTPFTQGMAIDFAAHSHVVFVCGHYEGIDERVVERFASHRVSLGDFVLSNGEVAACAIADAIVRNLPGVLGSHESLSVDSHNDGLLGAPNYTRPEEWRGETVSAVLCSGDHRAIATWQRQQSLAITARLRPDLLSRCRLEKGDANMLQSLLCKPTNRTSG